ncbi:DNA utilization protein HofM [Pseudescherichia vulneris]|uniref:DNA utilization protein HofM n=1 Tax=Pseudescherichia vulneris TaxID=566 RepID=UPI003015A93B
MAISRWRIGLHIQQDGVYAIALMQEKSCSALRCWWQLPLEAGTIIDGQIKQPERLQMALQEWSKTLPRRHQISLAFPARRTLQKRLPRPTVRLGESAQLQWVTNNFARELGMPADDLRIDYTDDSVQRAWSVTAAQNSDVAALMTLADNLGLHLSAITPDACALQRFIPLLAPPLRWLAWRDASQWLWATRSGWGRRAHEEANTFDDLAQVLGLPLAEGTLCDAEPGSFDPWSAIARLSPPLPENGAAWAVAIGLALGGE